MSTYRIRLLMMLFVTGIVAYTVCSMDFPGRCSQPGVIRWFAFDSQSEIAPFIYSGADTPEVDVSVKASGTGSILFAVPTNSPANTSGGFSINFTPGSSNYSDTNTYPIQFGEGGEFFIQWRQRFSSDFITRYYKGGGGWKQAIIGVGDRPGVPAYSCTQLEVVTQNNYHRGFPAMYHSCGVKDGQYEGLDIPYGAYDYKIQNAVDGCNYTLVSNSSSRADYIPPCIGYKANQWMTFQVHIKVGTWYKNDKVYHKDSWIQLWVADEDQPSTLVIDRNPANGTGYDLVNVENVNDKYGKIWLLPYNTGKDATEVHPTGYTWYDELIISRNRIPDPGSSSAFNPHDHAGMSAAGPGLFSVDNAGPVSAIQLFMTQGGFVQMEIINLVGKVVSVPINGNYAPGIYQFTNHILKPGSYMIRLQINGVPVHSRQVVFQ